MNYLNPYAFFIDLKNYLYDQNIFKQIRTQTKVVSIGNLNTGGSGKTPFIRYLAETLSGKKILIVCKSYKASLKQPRAVDLSEQDAVHIYGDEACLLKKLLPQCDVWSGPDKTQTVLEALQKTNDYELIFVDDGFSHRRLFRHQDIILFDTSRSIQHYELFPAGQMRESWKTLRRAQLVVLTKTEGLSDQKRDYFYKKIRPYQKNIIESTFKTVLVSDTQKIYLVSGIANPEKLKQDLICQGYSVEKQKEYPDHYAFPVSEQAQLLSEIKKHPDLQLVMTTKDYIKLTNQELIQKTKLVELKILISDQDRKMIYEKILS